MKRVVAGLPPERRPFQFFGWVALLSVPFYLLGWLAPELKRWMPVQFPISALMVVAPLFAAGLLTWRSEGQTGVRRLLSRTFDAKRVQHKGWLLVAFGIMPLVTLVAFMLQRKLGQTLPPAEPIWPAVIFYIAVYVLAAAAEEVGWTGYALEPLRQRYGLLGAGLLLGAVWWLWHALPFLMMGHGPALMFWTAVGTVAHRVLMTLLYDRTNGGVPSAVIYHTMINVTYSLYPVQGSHYDYRIVGVLLVLLCSLGALLPRQNHVPVRGVPS